MDGARGDLAARGKSGTHWRVDAVCASGDIDPDLFFPVGIGSAARGQELQAKRLCFACPALRACREWAQDIPALEGVWGGRSRRDRELYRRRRRQEPSSDEAPPPDTEHGRESEDGGRVAHAVQGSR